MKTIRKPMNIHLEEHQVRKQKRRTQIKGQHRWTRSAEGTANGVPIVISVSTRTDQNLGKDRKKKPKENLVNQIYFLENQILIPVNQILMIVFQEMKVHVKWSGRTVWVYALIQWKIGKFILPTKWLLGEIVQRLLKKRLKFC